MTERKPTAGFWIAVTLLAIVMLYPLSLGPACWISSRLRAGSHVVSVVYRPITWFVPTRRVIFTSNSLETTMRRYSEFAAAPDSGWYAISYGPGQPQRWEWGQIMVY